jgi:hypothetical protein
MGPPCISTGNWTVLKTACTCGATLSGNEYSWVRIRLILTPEYNKEWWVSMKKAISGSKDNNRAIIYVRLEEMHEW